MSDDESDSSEDTLGMINYIYDIDDNLSIPGFYTVQGLVDFSYFALFYIPIQFFFAVYFQLLFFSIRNYVY